MFCIAESFKFTDLKIWKDGKFENSKYKHVEI
jgi:hypothetical protein